MRLSVRAQPACSEMKHALTFTALLLAPLATAWTVANEPLPNPYPAKQGEYQTSLLIVGGSSSGTST